MDSNVAIKSDPLSQDVEDDYDLALRFQQLAAEGTHRLLVHPSSLTDFRTRPRRHQERTAQAVIRAVLDARRASGSERAPGQHAG